MIYRGMAWVLLAASVATQAAAQNDPHFDQARLNGKQFEAALAASQRVLKAWLNTLYHLREAGSGAEQTYLGSELSAGIPFKPGNWILEPVGPAPYARK